MTAPEAATARPARASGAGPVRSWPVLLLAAPAMVAIWSGWVGLGAMTGFGPVRPLPGIWDGLRLNTAVTLPVGMETYAAYALRVWLSAAVPPGARRFAAVSAVGSLLLGAAGQVAYHLMSAAHVTAAPWPVTTVVACLPVAVLGMGAALAHLIHSPAPGAQPHPGDVPAAAGAGQSAGQPPRTGPADPAPARVPAPRTGTPPRRRTGTGKAGPTGRRTDAELTAALVRLPREPDETVPVRRAAKALGCGPDRARRLLAEAGLLRDRANPPEQPSATAPVAA